MNYVRFRFNRKSLFWIVINKFNSLVKIITIKMFATKGDFKRLKRSIPVDLLYVVITVLRIRAAMQSLVPILRVG